ncbi:MAG: ribosome silencing factor [Pseudomonadota bacterium]
MTPFKKFSVAEVKDKAEALLRSALTKKALNPVLIRLAGLTAITDYFLIISGRSNRQVTAIAELIQEDAKKLNYARLSAEGVQKGTWALLDYGDVVVHVFQPEVRDFYDLEGLWAEAPRESFSPDLQEEIAAAASEVEDEEEWDEDD